MRLKTFVPLLLLGAAVAGCADLNTTDPNRQTNGTFWKTQSDALAGLTATYAGLPYQGTYGRWLAFAFDGRSDIALSNSPWTELANFNKFSIANYDFEVNYVIWHDHYATIARANQVIDNVPGISMDAALRSRIVGEAKFIRALLYSNLVNLYGTVPLTLHAADPSTRTPGVPPATTWTQIETDLRDARAALPVTYTGGDIGRATRGAADALLGKILLQQRKWPEAAAALSNVIAAAPAAGYRLVVYKDNFGLQRNNEESVFEVQMSSYDPANGLIGLNIGKFFGPPQGKGPGGPGFGDGQPTTWFFNQFTDTTAAGAVDPRRDENVFHQNSVYQSIFGTPFAVRYSDRLGDIFWKKWTASDWKNFQDFDEPIDYRVVRYADVLLMHAEAKNELNDQASAYTDVNLVRARAGVTPLPAGLTQAGMRAAILHERVVELGLEQVRWLDMRRQNLVADAASLAVIRTHDNEFSNFTIGKSELLPIPQSEVDLNPNIHQNPGW